MNPDSSQQSEPDRRGRQATSLDSWTAAACAELGLDPEQVDRGRGPVLKLARDVAHQVERPAAPLTAYLLGLAVGGGQPADVAVQRLSDRAAAWTHDPTEG
jgi:hypothetical protein